MKRCFQFALAPAVFAFALSTQSFAADPGYVDFGKLTGPAKGEMVDITLGKGVLKLVSVVAKCKNADAAQLINGLSRVRVNVVGLDDTNREPTTEKMSAIRQDLVRQGWEQIVAVQGKKQEDVAIFLKQRDGEIIDGIVVTVIDGRKNEAVFVNVVGQIRADQLATLAEHLNVPQLRAGAKPQKS